MIDNKKRLLVKAFTWRLLASTVLAALAWTFTGNVTQVTLIVLLYNIVQIAFYIIHEKLWNFIRWGKTKGIFIQMTGMSGAGKTTISQIVAKKLINAGYKVELIDGDEYRQNISRDLGFSKKDRLENINRLGFIGRVLARNNVIAIMAAINPYNEIRQPLQHAGSFLVYVRCGLGELERRDTKGLYYRARLPSGHPDRIENFTGISDPYDFPDNYDLLLDTEYESIEESANKLYRFILQKV